MNQQPLIISTFLALAVLGFACSIPVTVTADDHSAHCSLFSSNASQCESIPGCRFCNGTVVGSEPICYNTSQDTCCLWDSLYPLCPLNVSCSDLSPNLCYAYADCSLCGTPSNCYNKTESQCCDWVNECSINSTCCGSDLCCSGGESQCCFDDQNDVNFCCPADSTCCGNFDCCGPDQICCGLIPDRQSCCPVGGSCCGAETCCNAGEKCCSSSDSEWCCQENQSCGENGLCINPPTGASSKHGSI
jgi:hypothetical protein